MADIFVSCFCAKDLMKDLKYRFRLVHFDGKDQSECVSV